MINDIIFTTLPTMGQKIFFDAEKMLAKRYKRVAVDQDRFYYQVEGYDLAYEPDMVQIVTSQILNSPYKTHPDAQSLLRELTLKQKEIVIIGKDLPEVLDEEDFKNYLKLLLGSACKVDSLLKGSLPFFPDVAGSSGLASVQVDVDLKGLELNSMPTSLINPMFLNISNNQIDKLPQTFVTWTNLTFAYLAHNRLQMLPENLDHLTNLKYLSVANNCLHTLPCTLGQLKNLEHLSVAHNQLQSLPETVNELVHLRELILHHNQLNTLPDNFGGLASLKKLDLSHNQFINVPACLWNLPSTCEINLENNPLNLETLQQLQAQTAGPRFIYSAVGLEMHLKFEFKPLDEILQELCGSDFSKSFLNWEQEEQNNLSLWLQRLKETQDYKTNSAQVIDKTKLLLAWLEQTKSPEALVILKEASETCGDRVALAFNELNLLMKASLSSNLTLNEIKNLIVGMRRCTLLNKIATEKAASLTASDPIEVLLYYQTSLREELSLPLETKEMLYSHLANVTDADLQKAKKHILDETAEPFKILMQSETWKSWLKKQPQFASMEAHCAKKKQKALLQIDTTDEQISNNYYATFKKKDQTDWCPFYQMTLVFLKMQSKEEVV